MRIVLDAGWLRLAADRIDAAAHRVDGAVAALAAAAEEIPLCAETAGASVALEQVVADVQHDVRALHDAFDGPQAAQLRAIAAFIEAMDRPTWTSESLAEALLLAPLVLGAYEGITEADRVHAAMLVPDVDYWDGVRPGDLPPVLPWVRSGDDELAGLTRPNVTTFDSVVAEAGDRARVDGRTWVVSVVVGASLGGWAPVSAEGSSRGLGLPWVSGSSGERSELAVRPVRLDVVASNGVDFISREVPAQDRLGRSWIVGRGVSTEAGLDAKGPGIGGEVGESRSRSAGGYHGDTGTGWRFEVVPTEAGAVAVASNMSPLFDGDSEAGGFRPRLLDGSGT